jgi:hypothetical protein
LLCRGELKNRRYRKYQTIKSYFCHVRETTFSILKFGDQ